VAGVHDESAQPFVVHLVDLPVEILFLDSMVPKPEWRLPKSN
jgi:hypothetical protein